MLDIELSEPYPNTHTPTHSRTKSPKMPGEETNRLCGRGNKMAPAFLSQGRKKTRWEPVEALALVSSWQQMKLMDFSVFSLGSAFPKVLGWEEQDLLSCLLSSWWLTDLGPKPHQTVQGKKQKPAKDCCCSLCRPGKGEKRNFLLNLTKTQGS